MLSKYCWFVKNKIKNFNKRNQPKKLNQNDRVQNDLTKMAPWSSWIGAIWGTFWPIFLVKKTLVFCNEGITFKPLKLILENNINCIYKLLQDEMYSQLPNCKKFNTLQVFNSMCRLIQRACKPNVHQTAHLCFVFFFSILCSSFFDNYCRNDLLTLKCLIHLLLSYWVIRKWTYQVVDLASTQSPRS